MNGTTNKDRTLYYETLPANQLELALFLEADRMRSLAITREHLDNQRSAVDEERRRRYDNQPYGRTDEALDELAFDAFASAHAVIGSPRDLDAASLDDANAFFRTYYAPNNAVVAIVGDCRAGDALTAAKRYFSPILSSPSPPPVDLGEAPQMGERRRALSDPLAPLPRVDIGFKVPNTGRQSDALRALATILGGGRSSRLYERVVRDQHRATSVAISLDPGLGPALFRITATVAPGATADRVEAAVEAEIERLQTAPVEPWELQKARAAARMASVTERQRSASVAIRIAEDAAFFGDPTRINGFEARIAALTADEIGRLARVYFVADNRTVVITAKPTSDTHEP